MSPKYLKFILIVISGLIIVPAVWVLINGSTSTNLQSSIALLIAQTLLAVMLLINGAIFLEKGRNKNLGWFLFFAAVFSIAGIIASFFSISARVDSMLP